MNLHVINENNDYNCHFRVNLIDPIESIRSEMALWPNFKLFRPKFSPNRTKNGVFSLTTCIFVTSEGQKNDYFRDYFRKTRNTVTFNNSKNTEIIA